MNRYILISVLAFLIACEEVDFNTVEDQHKVEHKNPNSIFICYFPPMPTFPGGEISLRNFIDRNLKYPPQCKEGRVFVEFTIDEAGLVSEAKVIKGLDDPCDKNALDVFRNMPKWIPAKMYGKTVKAKMIYPVKFKLSQ